MVESTHKAIGLSCPEINCILAVRALAPATICQIIAFTHSDANRVLRDLRQMGIVERRSLKDINRVTGGRPPFLYSLTDRGVALGEHLFHAGKVVLEIRHRRPTVTKSGGMPCHPSN